MRRVSQILKLIFYLYDSFRDKNDHCWTPKTLLKPVNTYFDNSTNEIRLYKVYITIQNTEKSQSEI